MSVPHQPVASGNTATPADGAPSTNESTPGDRALALLRGLDEPLFGLLDAARDEEILALLRQGDCDYYSLYEGERGEQLADFAPYLVRLPPDSGLLGRLILEGWGESWGVYLTSRGDLAEVRRHFRHFLKVQLPGGKVAYFRFYDPRVLRAFLPACGPDELASFFGPVAMYMAEDQSSTRLLRFRLDGSGSLVEEELFGPVVRRSAM